MSLTLVLAALPVLFVLGWIQGVTNGDVFVPIVRQPPSLVVAMVGLLVAFTLARDVEIWHDTFLGIGCAGCAIYCSSWGRAFGYVMGGHVRTEAEVADDEVAARSRRDRAR